MAIVISVLFPRVFVRDIVYYKDLPCSIILANMGDESRETSHEVDEKTTAVRHRINADILPRKPCAECKHCKKVDECEGTVNIQAFTTERNEEWTAEEIRKTQEKYVSFLIQQKEDNKPRPEWEEVSPECPTLKTMWAQCKFLRVLRVEISMLKKAWVSADGKHIVQIVVPNF